MPFNDTAMQYMANALTAVATYGQLHDQPAGVDGTDNITSTERRPITWASATGLGDFNLALPVEFNGPADGPVFSITLWSASTSGVFYGEFAFTGGDPGFGPGGVYSLTAFDIIGAVIDEGSGS